MKYKGNIIFILLIILASFAVAASYFWNIKVAKEKTNDIVKEQSAAFFSEIVTTRQWNAGYGGVYVPVTEDIQPNPYLDIPDRDVYTTDSIFLTKINPAFMTRLISEIAAKKNGIKYHITSLKLTNPDNKADEWETKALKSFEKGKKEDFKFFEKDSSFRYMAPLMVTNACMKCHEKDGYKVGDVRGGISVTAPGKELVNVLDKQKTSILLAHILIFFTFLAFIIIVWVLNYKQFLKIRKNNELLSGFNKELELMQKESETLNAELITKSLETEQAKSEVEKYNAELLLQQEATEKLNQEIFAKSLEAEQARQELEDSTELIRSQAALSEILRNVTGKERSVEQFLNDALNKLLTFKWLNILDKGSISIIDDNNKEKIIAEKNINNKKVDENIEEIILPLKMADLTFGTLKIYKKTDVKHSEFIKNFFNTLSDTITSVINRKKTHNEIIKTKKELEEKNKHIRKYTVQLEQQTSERESLNQMILAQKKQVEQKNKEVQKQKDELELYAKELEKQSLEQETITQKLFAQKLEVEQRNMEVEQYSKQLEEHSKEQESLNQKLFAQKLEVEQRNVEVQEYLKLIEQQNLEQEKLNQQLFAQKMEVEQRSFEVERSSKEIAILKDKAEGSLKHLNDSINYSKYIQDSLLPLDSFMDENIPGDYFVYYKPKETIGGDFYYANKIDDYLVLAVADCTGHGVPGALITMLGITFLNDIVDKNLVDNAGAALNLLRKRIKTTFRSYGDNLQNKNGLDIALCAINLKTNIMQFSGAFNPLYIFRENELLEYKATRNPIGYYPVEKEFTTTEIKLQKDDVLYLFSDGYPDQIGGPKNRKFSKRQFKDLLQEIHTYPIAKQKVFTEKIMQRWMDGITQVDDITLMGIKWNN